MDCYTPQSNRRHNPVDSICRKLQTIQWRGDREPNSPFQIPKISSSNYDSPSCGLRHNLEAILKKGALHKNELDRRNDRVTEKEKSRPTGLPSPAGSQRISLGPSVPPSVPSTPACDPPTPANVTYTITSTLGERRGAEGSDIKQLKTWQQYCSTPTTQSKESPYFTFTRGPQSDSEEQTKSPLLSRTFTPSHNTMSYNLNFCSSNTVNSMDCDLPYPALVVKRLSMGDGAISMASERKKENMAEISLICEENLLDTIFHACDTQRRGKVYVSHIVDYLRHTTSRSSGDSGLDELCNMLDPEHKDVSIDLDTYHAVMREWIDDCRNISDEQTNDTTQDSVKLKDCLSAKRSLLLNMTSGSLEAFGGEASRVEFETSELVYCVADLQMCNQKLQEEVRKLKQVVEGMEDANQKMAEENEELRSQARLHQQLAQKEKLLKEEVEEMKATLSCTEEGRARASAHSKNVEKENQELIAKIACLQEENFKVSMETEELQRRIRELCDTNTDLQVQIHSFDSVVSDKEAVVQEKSRQIRELKAAVEEYSSVIELLRADKNKLESQMQLIHPDLVGAGLPFSFAYRLNQSSSGSLQTELALAQSPLEISQVMDHLTSNMNITSPLDETLDKEVFLLMQGPTPDPTAVEFKSLLNKLKRNFTEEANSVISTMKTLLDEQKNSNLLTNVQAVQAELDARRSDWAVSLDQLAQYTDSLEKELIKMASNMRRSRTEILHLSVRVQEQENQKRQLCEELEQLKTPQDSREASCQTPAPEEEPAEEALVWEDDGEFLLQDFLSNDLDKRRRPESRAEDSVEGGGRDRDTSTPLSIICMDTRRETDSAVLLQPQLQTNFQLLQENTAVLSSTHSRAVSVRHPEAGALYDPSHSVNNSASDCFANNLSHSQEQEHSVATANSPTKTPNMVSLHGPSTGSGEVTTCDESLKLLSEEQTGAKEKRSGVDDKTGDMNSIKSLKQDQLADRAAAEDSVSLLPVLVEEEECVQDSSAEVPAGAVDMAASDRVGVVHVSSCSSPQSGPLVTISSQLENGRNAAISDPSQSTQREGEKNMKELGPSGSMDVSEDRNIQEDQSACMTNRRHSDTSMTTDSSDVFREDSNSLTPTDKEIEAEFQRLALGFKCDMFTLEKRLRLEERSRDLAEENVRREVSSCQGLLQALIPLCDDDSQSMEIIQRLQKNLDILIQSMTRVSSRSEMLGAIHQENRIGKAVEVMIQHVENLKRMYAKEHAELLELRETMLQNERSFGSQTEKDDFRGKKQTASQFYKSSVRRVSIAAIPRSGGSNVLFDLSKPQEPSEADTERLTRRSPWNGHDATDCQSQNEQKEEPVAERRKSSLTELGNIITSFILPQKTSQDELFVMLPSPSSSPTSADPGIVQSLSQSLMPSRATAAAVARGSRGLWIWLALLLVLAGLLALLASLVMQPVVDAAPVGTGDSWMTIQQLLWPYTGLRHNGQPPV